MKEKLLLLVLMIALCCACQKIAKPESDDDLESITFKFIVVDEKGHDMFFSDSSQFDPGQIKYNGFYKSSVEQGEYFDTLDYFGISVDTTFCTLSNLYLTHIFTQYSFLIEFLPEDVDTVLVKSSKYQSDPGYNRNYDVLFNGELVCEDCSYIEIYKIEKK